MKIFAKTKGTVEQSVMSIFYNIIAFEFPEIEVGEKLLAIK